MPSRISQHELHRLRNGIDVAGLIDHLAIPWKLRDGYFRFLCPLCADFHTATNPRTNLARCFRCKRNFNPIDLIMLVEKDSFLEAVHYLRQVAPYIRRPTAPG
jgi:hypothetical protein